MNFEKIYQQIAEENGISVEEVREEMQKAITAAWTDHTLTEAERERQRSVPFKGEIPTPDEIIRYCIGEIAKGSMN